MTTLKGQNFRIYTINNSDATVIGMATNCTVTLNSNVDDSGTKDDVGMAAKPVVTSKSWQVQVESLNVADVGAMLTAIKNMTKFVLMWDESSTTDNQSELTANFARSGEAYLTDGTFNFNDRENSAKSLQFTGIGPIIEVSSAFDDSRFTGGSYTKGQFVRLYLSSDNTAAPTAVIAAAKQLSLHVSMTLEDATTKDTEGDWQIQEPTALNYDISTTALVRSGDTITSSIVGKGLADLETIYENSNPVKWKIANTSGANNRTAGTVIASGSCLVQTLTMNGPNKQNATYTASLVGYGAYTVGS